MQVESNNLKKKNKIGKRVMLIVPPRTVDKQVLEFTRIVNIFPLGPMYIAALLEKNNYSIKILDCLTEKFEPQKVGADRFRYGLSDIEILKRVKEFAPDYIGISCLFSTNYQDFANLCKILKANFSVPLIAGGQHVTADYVNILKNGVVDYCILGEGEHAMLNLLNALNNNLSLDSINGLVYRKDDKLAGNPKIDFIENLDELPLPAYHLLDFEKYMESGHSHGDTTPGARWAPIVTSRGCPFKCSFCFGSIMSGRKIRGRSPENVIEEIQFLKEKFDINELSIEDDNFCHNPSRANKILDETRKIGITLIFPTGLSLYSLRNDDTVKLLKENDVLSINIAIESGDPHILADIMHKPANIPLIKEVVNKLKNNDIVVKGFFVLGMPGETTESLQNTFNLIRDIKLDWNCFNVATPLPGTEMAQVCIENNYINKKYMGSFENINFSESVIDTPYLTHNSVNKYFYYFNIFTNFISPLDDMSDEKDMKYKDFMYRRVLKIAPGHKFADSSLQRLEILKKICEISGRKDENSANKIIQLKNENISLRNKQMQILDDELSKLAGEIIFY